MNIDAGHPALSLYEYNDGGEGGDGISSPLTLRCGRPAYGGYEDRGALLGPIRIVWDRIWSCIKTPVGVVPAAG